jgi:hypothetical protein
MSGTLFKLAYQISPIILSGGIASLIPGGLLPIVVLTEGVSAVAGATGGLPSSLDGFFAQFMVLPGSSLIRQDIAHYPFANQAEAANAVVTQPLQVSVQMDCPAQGEGGYLTKVATMAALQAALSAHNASGGLYIVMTPAFPYQNLIMTDFKAVDGAGSAQVQYRYQMDFEQPLVTLQAAEQVMGNLFNQINGGTQIAGVPSFSSIASAAGGAISGIGSTIVSAALNLAGIQSISPSAVVSAIS